MNVSRNSKFLLLWWKSPWSKLSLRIVQVLDWIFDVMILSKICNLEFLGFWCWTPWLSVFTFTFSNLIRVTFWVWFGHLLGSSWFLWFLGKSLLVILLWESPCSKLLLSIIHVRDWRLDIVINSKVWNFVVFWMLICWWGSSWNFILAFTSWSFIRITSWDIDLLSISRISFVLPSTGSIVTWEIVWSNSWFVFTFEWGAGWNRVMLCHSGWNIPLLGHAVLLAFAFSILERVACWDGFFLSSRWDVPLLSNTVLLAFSLSIFERVACWDWLSLVKLVISSGSVVGLIGTWDVVLLSSTVLLAFTLGMLERVACWDGFFLSSRWDVPLLSNTVLLAFALSILERVACWDRIFLNIGWVTLVLPSGSTVVRWKVIRSSSRFILAFIGSAGWNRLGSFLSIAGFSSILPSIGSIISRDIPIGSSTGLLTFALGMLERVACWNRFFLTKLVISVATMLSLICSWH